MPSFDAYQKMYGGKTQGQVRKDDSDMVMLATWDEDISSRVGYFYTQALDDEFEVSDDLHPEKSKTKIPIDIKFYEVEYNSLAKDEVGQHLMFKPDFNYKTTVPYYEEEFVKRLGASFPNGLFCDVADDKGIYHRYLCVDHYREHPNQFPSHILLPCNFKMRWIYKNRKMETWCVLRSQNSYNSGVWVDYKVQSVENQKISWMSFNDITKTIFYDTRVAISQDRDIPVAWSCSKVEDMNIKGIARYTFKQDLFDEHNDYIERDKDGVMIGVWCNYFKSNIPPEDPEPPSSTVYCTITHSGTAAEIKTGGSYKKFTVTFYDADGETAFQQGTWSFAIDGVDASSLLTIKTKADDPSLNDNQIKIKFAKDDSYIGKNLEVKFEADVTKIKDTQLINIVGL